MFHASLAYPSYLIPILETGLVLLGLLAALAWPARGEALAARVMAPISRWARPRWRAVLLVGLLAGLGNAATSWLQGVPIPGFSDEFSYLLAADTFASGRLANPPAPHPALVGENTLGSPSYASKYPPAQGLILALGQRLGGHPAVGLWLSAALLAAAVTWCLQAWVPARWALLGGLLVVLRLAVGSYWNQSYWGGSVAAVGGALVYGALRRLVERPHARQALLLGLGVAILANSRPLEGLLVSLPAAAFLVYWFSRLERSARRQAWLRVVTPLGLVLGVTALWMLYYNERVTGDPFLMPHTHYKQVASHPGEFVWQHPPRTTSQHDLFGGLRASADDRARLGVGIRQGLFRVGLTLFFMIGPALVVPLLLGAGALRERWWWLAGIACLMVLLGHFIADRYFSHYAAPLTAPLWALAIGGLSGSWKARWRQRAIGPSLTVLAVLVCLISFLVQLPAYRFDAAEPVSRRVEIQRNLEATPEPDLVLVPSGVPFNFNPADLESAPVLWAADLGPTSNHRLFELFPDRRRWQLDAFYEMAPLAEHREKGVDARPAGRED